MQPCISVFLLVRKPKKEKVDRRKRSSFPRCLLFSMKAQRARELAQSMCLMNGRRSFCIQRHSDDSLRIVRTCRTDSEGSGRHSPHQERLCCFGRQGWCKLTVWSRLTNPSIATYLLLIITTGEGLLTLSGRRF